MSRARLLAYAAPAIPLALLGIPLTVYLPAMWTAPGRLSLAAVGAVFGAVRLLDVFTDPLIGRISDRLGRRKPLIGAALIPLALGVVGLAFPPAHAGAIWLAAAFALVTLGWTMLSLPYQAWGAELSDDYAERARITGWRESGTVAGITLSAALPAAFGISGGADGAAASMRLLAALSVALAPPLVVVLLRAVPERPHRPTRPAPLLQALKIAAANRPFRRLLLGWAVNGLANGLPAALFFAIMASVLRAPAASGPVLLAYFLSALAGIPLWTALARRIGKHRAWIGAMAVMAASFAFVPLLGPGDVTAFAVISLVSGLGYGADLSLPPAIQADVVDLDELESGEKRAGLYFAAWTMAQKAGNAAAPALALPLLQWAGYRSGAAENPHGALLVLLGLYCLLPLVLKLSVMALMWRFPLNAAEQARLRAAIAARAAA
ncbi:MAG: MFS transporter [Rhodospirillales bacterium]|nr:MFS transporter [Rhodospirillales bacterium]